jgi:hypothetical protein
MSTLQGLAQKAPYFGHCIPVWMARHVVQVANVSAGMGLFEGLQMEQVHIALWQDYFVGRSTLLCLGS